ncbi:hypothetical protein F2P81_022488 [Scophthalmus maximus]|uniref:Uncharacterized protein n=1 Tax=Scophthalmus maximus TaxID=52904 RepID=A0A6A4RYD9_SCOMX|nr:hypothetical protein F2P81_022488 [Scophthalmus maximus]
MYYKFSGITQKLTGSAPTAAYSPQGLRPSVPAESPTMIFATPTKLVSEAGATVEYMGASKINELQKLFQVGNKYFKTIKAHSETGLNDHKWNGAHEHSSSIRISVHKVDRLPT